jgi:hypothetical protein
MNTTTLISLGVMAVLIVLYMMRRKARLSRED